MIELGVRAKDKITGFSGTVTSRHQSITGCDQYLITPDLAADGKLSNGQWFDEMRIEITDHAVKFVDIRKVNPTQAPG